MLIGGTVLPLLGIDHRVTMDIDLIPLKPDKENSSLLSLMELAEKLDLPVETINSAGLYFLKKIPNYHTELVIFISG